MGQIPPRRPRLPRAITVATALLALCLAGCATSLEPVQTDDDDDDTEEPELVGWEGVFALISFRCGCHDAEQREGGMWDLTDEESAWDALVGTPSNDVPGVLRVDPGDPDASYMFLKVTDRQFEVGGAGDRMPPTGFALPEDDVELIREWIAEGALE